MIFADFSPERLPFLGRLGLPLWPPRLTLCPFFLYPRPTLDKLMTPRSSTELSAVTSPSFRWLSPLSDWWISSLLLNLQPGLLQVGRVKTKWALVPALWSELGEWATRPPHTHQTTLIWQLGLIPTIGYQHVHLKVDTSSGNPRSLQCPQSLLFKTGLLKDSPILARSSFS